MKSCPRFLGFLWRTHKWSDWEITSQWFQHVPATSYPVMVGKIMTMQTRPAYTAHVGRLERQCNKCSATEEKVEEI